MLGLSAAFNMYTFYVAQREFRAGQGNHTFREALRKAKDPTVLTVLFEDTASLLGLLFAFLGITLGKLLHRPMLDSIASVLIGLLLAVVAIGLVWQSKTLLVGETANDEVVDSIRHEIENDQAVAAIDDLLTMHLSPEDILLNVKIRFEGHLNTQAVGAAVDRLEHALRKKHPEIKRIYIEPGPLDAAESQGAAKENPRLAAG